MSTLVSSYRKAWRNDNRPFYYAQIAPHTYSVYGHPPEALPFFWEAQTRVLTILHMKMTFGRK
jgi:sialate O-acetylesterase